MKTRLLIIIGILIAIISAIVLLLFLNAYFTVISEYPPLKEETKSYLSSKCGKIALLHIQKHSSYLSDVDRKLMAMQEIGLPMFLDSYSLDQCVKEILDKRGFTVTGNPNECWYQEVDGTMKQCVSDDESMMLPLCMNLKSDYVGKCIVPLSGPDALCINGSLHYPPDENGVGKIIDDGCW